MKFFQAPFTYFVWYQSRKHKFVCMCVHTVHGAQCENRAVHGHFLRDNLVFIRQSPCGAADLDIKALRESYLIERIVMFSSIAGF